MGELILGEAVEAGGVAFEEQKQFPDGKAGVAPHVEKKHGVGTAGLSKAGKKIGLGINLGGDEMVVSVVARWKGHEIKLFFLHDQGEGEE